VGRVSRPLGAWRTLERNFPAMTRINVEDTGVGSRAVVGETRRERSRVFRNSMLGPSSSPMQFSVCRGSTVWVMNAKS